MAASSRRTGGAPPKPVTGQSSPAADRESAQLLREFSLANAFSLAFAFISPIVGLYSIFSLGLAAAGPGFWFGFPIVLAGQMLVALVFGMLAARFPYEGSVYQWSGHLIGPRYAWFAGWTYVWVLPISMGAVALAGSYFLAQLAGLDPHSHVVILSLSAALLAFATWGNTHGRFILNAIVGLCIAAEVIASVGVGILLLVFHRVHPLSFLVSNPHLFGNIHSVTGLFQSPLATSVAIAGWALLGFESAGSVAEEVRSPERAIPKAMLYSLLCVAGVISFSALSMILAIPDIDQALRGEDADPVASTLTYYFGKIGFKGMLSLFMVGFVACILGTQASVSRVIWAFARNDALPGSRWLKKLSAGDRLPVNAILLTSFMAAGMLLFSLTNVYSTLVSFTTAGFYIAFSFPLLAAAWVRLTGRWRNGPFHLGPFTGPTIYAAAAWIVFETANIAWPRLPSAPWYENWAVPVMAALIGGLGVLVRLLVPTISARLDSRE
jgi:amino acid transporter